jgi:hypothetical protein
MRSLRYLVILFFFVALPSTLLAGMGPGDLPAASKWYFHIDFKEMRSSEAGRHLYGWLQDEVFDDIREDVGVDLDKEADFLTAFATAEEGTVVVIEGRISQQTTDKLLAMGAASGSLDQLESGGKTFYHVAKNGDDDGEDGEGANVSIELDSFDDGAYFSFAIRNKILVTATKERMQRLLADKGKFSAGTRGGDGALFVLSAERDLVQAGARADDLGNNGNWDSNILRNTEQAALLIADKAGKIAVEAQLVTTEKAMADSLASIVRGLISLQIFNDDMDPEVAQFLQNTSVDVEDNTLKISIALDPEVVVAAID